MLYIQRNTQGQIVAIHKSPTEDANEAVTADNHEVVAFLAEQAADGAAESNLIRTDIDLVRVLEDLIELLIEKNHICLTDLPLAAQDKLLNRKQIRSNVSTLAQLLVDEDELL